MECCWEKLYAAPRKPPAFRKPILELAKGFEPLTL